MAFVRKPGIRWVASQVERFKREGANYNRRVKRAWDRYGYEGQPPTVDLDALSSDIQDSRELNRTIAQWRRFNERTRPGSTKPVESGGHIVPAQMVREQRYAVRLENVKRRKLINEIAPGYDEMTPIQQATVLANKNLSHVKVPKNANPLDALGKFGMYGHSDAEYADNYISTLQDVAGSDRDFDEVIETIERLKEENPYALRVIFENADNDDEIEIGFIYKSDKSYDQTPWGDTSVNGRRISGKKSRIIDFWKRQGGQWLS